MVLVHGIFDTARVFSRMAPHLEARGWTTHAVSLSPNSGRGGLDRLAFQLQTFISERIEPDKPFDLVGFSMGGLIARYYVQRLGCIERVRRFVTVSTPHHGSYLAYLLPNEGCRQMRPGSAFIEDLNRDVAMLERVGMASLWTPFDLSILPATSSLLPIGRQARLPVLLHPLMLWDRRCLDRVAQWLEAD